MGRTELVLMSPETSSNVALPTQSSPPTWFFIPGSNWKKKGTNIQFCSTNIPLGPTPKSILFRNNVGLL